MGTKRIKCKVCEHVNKDLDSWDHSHHITASIANDTIHLNNKSFFDRPVGMENGKPLSPLETQKRRVGNPWGLPEVDFKGLPGSASKLHTVGEVVSAVKAASMRSVGTWQTSYKPPLGATRIGGYSPSAIYCRENLDRGRYLQQKAFNMSAG